MEGVGAAAATEGGMWGCGVFVLTGGKRTDEGGEGVGVGGGRGGWWGEVVGVFSSVGVGWVGR